MPSRKAVGLVLLYLLVLTPEERRDGLFAAGAAEALQEIAFRKAVALVVLYWHVVGVTGFRQAAQQRLTPGSLCSPLFPQIVGYWARDQAEDRRQ